MIKTIKTIDYFAWISLGLIFFLGYYSQRNYTLFNAYPVKEPAVFGVVSVALCLLAGRLRRYMPAAVDWMFALMAAAWLYTVWPHLFFDDAGFILRYLDQSVHGGWFRYNAGEGPVFGISGFIHGLFATLLVKAGAAPERALHMSNFVGLAAALFFLAGIFRRLVPQPGWAYAAALVAGGLTKTWCDVLFTGMETPLHVALILGTFYFMLCGRIRSFYLFAALSVVSKLDAVPVVGVLLLLHVVESIHAAGLKKTWAAEWKAQSVWFWLPLAAWTVFAARFFGSPFPQSAKAKVLYYSGRSDNFFPFLEGFSRDFYKHPMLGLLGIFFVLHLFLIRKKGLSALTRHFGFGWMFAGIMLLYYWYNPDERMLWYYALPDLLLTAQCVLSGLWLASQAKDWKHFVLPPLTLFCWIVFLKPDVDAGRNWMRSYLDHVERERYEIGRYIAAQARPGQTLMAWHGLIARPFPGFVFDGTGLNYKKAVELGLDRDKMLSVLQPTFGIHHGEYDIMRSFCGHGYFVKGLFADITLQNSPAWIWWEKGNDNRVTFDVSNITEAMVSKGTVIHASRPLKTEGRAVRFALPVKKEASATLWFAQEGTGRADRKLGVRVWTADTLLLQKEIPLPAPGGTCPSVYTTAHSLPLYTAGRVPGTPEIYIEFTPRGLDTAVKINHPIIEYRVSNTPE